MKTQAEIARAIAPVVGKGNVRSTTAFLSQIIRGERKLPEAWKVPLMTALGIQTEIELVAMYPKMGRADVAVVASSSFVVTITQSEPSTVDDSGVASILTLVAALKKHGISLKVTVEPAE